jgi:uncharacterized protein with GYD domain
MSGTRPGARVLDFTGQDNAMTKYLFEANYVGEGIKGLMREGGTKRRDALVDALKSVGGTLECMYYAFGHTDVLGVFDVPSDADAAALSLMINSTGNVNVRFKPLMTPEDIDEAAKKTPTYRAPGQ